MGVRRRRLAFAAAWCLACACGPPTRTLAPPAPEDGRLEVRVLGAPGPVEYFLDGARLRPGPAAWQGDARMAMPLPAGRYEIVARYRIGRFGGRTIHGVVRGVQAVRVDSGRTTRLLADLRRDWPPLPEETVTHFHVDEPAVAVARARPRFSTRSVPVATDWPVVGPETVLEPDLSSDFEFGLVPAPAGGRAVPEQITIRGAEVYVGGRRWTGRASVPARPVADGAGPPLEVTVVLRSEPPGAHVRLDGRYLGRTPLRARVDPRRDHALAFERPGCQEQVRVLAAEAWTQGRAPEILVRLDCR